MNGRTKTELARHVYERLARELQSAGRQARDYPELTPYMVSILVYDVDDDPSLPSIAIALEYPPEEEDERAQWAASGELQWNYAALSQSSVAEMGHGKDDPDTQRLIAELFAGEPVTGRTALFVAQLVLAVQQVHRNQLTEAAFGTPVPLLIHELEYYQEIARQNVQANGIEITRDFVNWIRQWFKAEKLAAFDRDMQQANDSFLRAMQAG